MIRRRPSPAAGLRHWQLAFNRPPAPPDKTKAAGLAPKAAYERTLNARDTTPLRRARQRGRIEVDAVFAAHLLLAVVVGILWELTR